MSGILGNRDKGIRFPGPSGLNTALQAHKPDLVQKPTMIYQPQFPRVHDIWLRLLVVQLAGYPNSGPSIREMVQGATRIWSQVHINLVPEFLPPLGDGETRRLLVLSPVAPLILITPDLNETLRESFWRGGLSVNEDDFHYPLDLRDGRAYPGDPTHPWRNLANFKGSRQTLAAFFADLEWGTALADPPRFQVYLEGEYTGVDTLARGPAGRTLAHELGHILIADSHPGDPGGPTSELMLQSPGAGTRISEADAEIEHRAA